MTVLYEADTSAKFTFDPEVLGNEVVNETLRTLSFPYEAEVSLTLVSEQTIHEMNRTFRSIDRSTDVLSFPLLSFPSPGDFSEIEADPDNFNPDSGEVMLGDIVISAAHVKAQADEYGHSEKREYAFLIVHSLLHLMGYDHMEDKDRELMENRQKCIMERLSILRD